jgi:hypothetical protein
MKRFMLVPLVLLSVVFLTTGCGGKGDETSGETSSEKNIEKQEEVENLYLTEKEVKAFIKAYPVFVKITEKKKEDIEPLADKEDLISGMKITSEFNEYAEEIDAALKDYGFTLESFSAAYGKIMAAYAYGQMAGAAGEMMKKMLENPNVPEEQKEEIRKSMKEAEESEEMQASKANWEIVKKYQEEIENLLKEQ